VSVIDANFIHQRLTRVPDETKGSLLQKTDSSCWLKDLVQRSVSSTIIDLESGDWERDDVN
jgi:hypothetical protein